MSLARTGVMRGFVAFLVLAGYFGVLLIVIGKPDMRDAMLILVGALGAAVGSMIQYYFGSSSSSARKDEILAQSINKES